MPRPFKWAEYFNKDAALQNRSNKYQVSCIRCHKKIPKGRSEERTRHLVDECTGLTPDERDQIIRVEAKEAEAAAAGTPKPRAGKNSKGGGAGLGETEIEELLRLARSHSIEGGGQEGWQGITEEYNNWAESNGFKTRTSDALQKQWNSRVANNNNSNSRLQGPANFSWDVTEARVIPWEITALSGFDEDEGGDNNTDHDALATDLAGGGGGPSSGYNIAPPPPRFDPELSALRDTTPPTNLSPPQSTNSSQRRQYRQADYSSRPPPPPPPPPPTAKEPVMNATDPRSSSSLIELLQYENTQKEKRIERLEAREDKLQEKIERLECRNRKLEEQNRKLESQNQVLKMRFVIAEGSGTTGAKRKRGGSDFLTSDLQDVENQV